MVRSFTTTDKPPPPRVEFELDGRRMTFTSPGWAPMMFVAEDALSAGDSPDMATGLRMIRGLLDWLGAGLSTEDGEHILARLRDPEDPLDVEDAVAVIHGLVEEVTARPTTPPSDSSPSPEPTPSTVGRHQEESTPPPSASVESVTSPTTT